MGTEGWDGQLGQDCAEGHHGTYRTDTIEHPLMSQSSFRDRDGQVGQWQVLLSRKSDVPRSQWTVDGNAGHVWRRGGRREELEMLINTGLDRVQVNNTLTGAELSGQKAQCTKTPHGSVILLASG